MAETSYQTSPKLTQTTDALPYAPISLFAVAAAVSALIFALIFTLLAISSILKKQPMIMTELLFLPALTLVLAFAAFCHIRNSEGTRTGKLFGINLVSMAAGIALLVGAGYAAYLGAIEFAVRKDAENVFVEWTNNLKELNPTDSNDVGIARAVHRTLEPSAQARIPASDVAGLRAAYAENYLQFSQCDMVRICRRNPGKVEFKPLGLVEWVRKQQRVMCTLNADVISPEGVHTISLKMIADIAPNGQRLWGLENKPAYVTSRRLTPYGKKVEELEIVGGLIAQRFIEPLGPQFIARMSNPDDVDALHRRLYIDFMHNTYPPAKDYPLLGVPMRTALGGGIATYEPPAIGYEKKLFDSIFQPILPAAGLSPDDKLKLEAEAKQKFIQVWNGNRFARPGSMLRNSKDVFPILTLDDKSVRCSVPLEMVLPGSETPSNTARGRVILESIDPETIAELNSLRGTADPNKSILMGYPEAPKTIIPWRVIRIESDMNPAPAASQQKEPQPAPEMSH
jgi:hypothetical protein